MPSMAAVQDCRKTTVGMHRDVHRKITQHELPAHRAQRPLVRQQYGTIGALAGQISGRLTRRLRRSGDARGECQEAGGGRQYPEKFHKQECASYASIRRARKDATSLERDLSVFWMHLDTTIAEVPHSLPMNPPLERDRSSVAAAPTA